MLRPPPYSGLLLALCMAAVAPDVSAQERIAGGASAVEGDIVNVDDNELRLFGIDAPDRGQVCQNVRNQTYDCFALSRLALERLIGNRQIACELRPGAATARIATCQVEGQDLATLMVLSGWALAYRRISDDYIKFERIAISRRAGMWAGRVEPSWLWRNRQLLERRNAPAEAPAEAPDPAPAPAPAPP